MIRFAVIGYGYWGPNIVRNLQGLGSAQLVTVCDKSEASLRRAKAAYPDINVTTDCSEVLQFPGYRRCRGDHAGLDSLDLAKRS